MATYKKQLKDYQGNNIIPALGQATVSSENIDWNSILIKAPSVVKYGRWTTPSSISGIANSIVTDIDISDLGFRSADDYRVIFVVNGVNATNGFATKAICSNSSATYFRIRVYNDHWSGGVIGEGVYVDWYVLSLNDRRGDEIAPINDVDASYSLTETRTNGVWIDGKPIYKRTYNCGSLLNNGTRYVNHGITNLGVIMKSEAFAVYEGSVSTGVNLPIPYTAPTGIQNTVTVNFTSTQICLTTGTDRTAATAYVTIWYTKK